MYGLVAFWTGRTEGRVKVVDLVQRRRATGREADLAVAGAVAILLVAYVPGLDNGPVSARLLVALPLGAVGLVGLVRLAVHGDPAARWGAGFLVWAAVAAAGSDDVRRSFTPGLGTDRGWVVLAAFGGCWAVGRQLGVAGPCLVQGALLAGAAVNGVVAVAQVMVEGSGLLAPSDGRAIGMFPSAVYLGGLFAGALPLAVARLVRGGARWGWWAAPVALFAMGAEASGSRVGLVAGIVVSCWVLRAGPARRAAVVLVAVVAGVVVVQFAAGDSSTTGRLGESGTGGIGPRVQMWEVALDHTLERPVVGWGPNRFSAVASPHVTESFARAEGPDKVFFDAHNLVAEHALGTGVVGVVLLGGFAVTAGRRASGPLAVFAAGVALTWLLEPASVATAPVALIALGAASPRRSHGADARWAPAWTLAAVSLAIVALLGAARIVAADRLVHRGIASASVQDLDAAADLLPSDAVISDARTQQLLALARVTGDPGLGAEARAAARRTLELEPDRATWWFRAADVAYEVGEGSRSDRAAEARRLLLRANDLQPWSASTLAGLATVERELGDPEAAARWRGLRCRVVTCEPEPAGG